jgi:hypothetical protein
VLPSQDGAALTDEDVERRLRWLTTDCVDPEAIDQGNLLAFSEGPVALEVAQPLQAHLALCEYCSALSAEYRRIAHERKRKRTFLQIVASASVAAAAAIVTLALAFPFFNQSRAVREYEFAQLRGDMARTMALPREPRRADGPYRFAPTSPIEIVLRPTKEQSEGDVPTAGVYVAPRGGPLSRVLEVTVSRGKDELYPLLTISGTGERVFGRSSGQRDFVVVLAPTAAELDAVQGRTLEEARNNLPRDTQLLDFDVVYEDQQ